MNPALSVEEALQDVEFYATSFTVLPVPEGRLVRVASLSREAKPTRRQIFDVVLAATMLGNGVIHIYTFDVRHFDRIPGIKILTP